MHFQTFWGAMQLYAIISQEFKIIMLMQTPEVVLTTTLLANLSSRSELVDTGALESAGLPQQTVELIMSLSQGSFFLHIVSSARG